MRIVELETQHGVYQLEGLECPFRRYIRRWGNGCFHPDGPGEEHECRFLGEGCPLVAGDTTVRAGEGEWIRVSASEPAGSSSSSPIVEVAEEREP